MTDDKELATGVRKELLTPDARGHCSLIFYGKIPHSVPIDRDSIRNDSA